MLATATDSYRIACAIPGRIRIQLTDPRLRSRALYDVRERLASLSGVEEARVIRDARSVALRCAANRQDMNGLLQAVRKAVGASIGPYLSSPVADNAAITRPFGRAIDLLAVSDGRQRKLNPLLLPSAALAAVALEAVPAAAAGAVVAASALPIARRAAKGLDRKRVTLAEMDLASVIILAITGRLFAAAEVTWLTGLADLVATRNARRAREALVDSIPAELAPDSAKREAIARAIEEAPAASPQAEQTLERISGKASKPLAGAALATYLLTRNPLRAIAVMKLGDISSTHRISASTVTLTSLANAARQGILIRGGDVLERLAAVGAVVVDAKALDTTPNEMDSFIEEVLARGIRRVVVLTGSSRRRTAERDPALGDGVVEAPADSWRAVLRGIADDGMTAAFVWNGGQPYLPSGPGYIRIALKGGALEANQDADVVVLDGRLDGVTRGLDLAREATNLLRQNMAVVAAPNGAAFAAAALGFLSSVGSSVVSTTTAIAAGLNAMKPLGASNPVGVRGRSRRIGRRVLRIPA